MNSWREPPHPLQLQTGEVHVWRASLDLDDASLRTLALTLSPDEHNRAARFCFPKDQRRFVGARGILRNILGQYLRQDPSQLSFSYGANGKPALVGMPRNNELRFNLSHSGGLALYAVARTMELGVDVEQIQMSPIDDSVAESFFTVRETAALRALPREIQAKAFFNCWTAKEAFLKFTGTGIAEGAGAFEVSLCPDGLAYQAAGMHDDCSLTILAPASEYVAALVLPVPCTAIQFWEWDVRNLRRPARDCNLSLSVNRIPDFTSEAHSRA